MLYNYVIYGICKIYGYLQFCLCNCCSSTQCDDNEWDLSNSQFLAAADRLETAATSTQDANVHGYVPMIAVSEQPNCTDNDTMISMDDGVDDDELVTALNQYEGKFKFPFA